MSQLNIGDLAPDFTLPTDGQGSISLSSLKGKNVVLYFYPKDDTPGCTIEAKDFRDLKEEFVAKNTVIIGLSKDNVEKHNKFKAKYDLNFTLASDENVEVCQKYNVWMEKSMFGKKYMGIDRSSFLIDEDGKIKNIWKKVKVTNHAKEILNQL